MLTSIQLRTKMHRLSPTRTQSIFGSRSRLAAFAHSVTVRTERRSPTSASHSKLARDVGSAQRSVSFLRGPANPLTPAQLISTGFASKNDLHQSIFAGSMLGS